MNRFLRCALASALIMVTPIAAIAQRHPGGGGAGRGAPMIRSAPQPRRAPSSTGGFDFNRDINARPQAPAQPIPRPPARGNFPARSEQHAPNNAGNGPRPGSFRGPTIPNPRHWSGGWGWNHGVLWNPAPTYWGGGFWGPWAMAELGGAILFGSIVDDQDQLIYPSYEVEPDSPGAQLLQNYGLQQTECGPPDLVVIWGPDNSVICAYPNDLVAPGTYNLDPSTLTIVSQ